MPLFDLTCPACKSTVHDKLTTSKQDVPCPSCECKMIRLVTKANFELKGNGWAKDGYK